MKRFDIGMIQEDEGQYIEYADVAGLFTAAQMREAFVAGAYWGMDNPFGPDADIPQSEAIRRWSDKEKA